ncbi:MAG: ABC-type sulfate/molybdate transport systems ATPase subunit, partial [Myxococcota bacterium]
MLSLRNIEKSFGDVIAVAKVNIEVPAGKSLALIRAGGSGKSALLRWMLGLERPDRGEIHFDGQ